jgi:hypothetical protein
MKTRDELLAMADHLVSCTYEIAMNEPHDFHAESADAIANLAQACVILAKELREGTPEYVLDDAASITIESMLRERCELERQKQKEVDK